MFLSSPVFVVLSNGFGTEKTCIDAVFLYYIL